jgi:ribosome biogenesis protein Tsr3
MPRIESGKWSSGAVTVKPLPQIQNQVGPTCGLTALSIVMNFWYTLLMARYSHSPMEQPIPPLPSARDPKAKSTRERLMEEIRDAKGQPTKRVASPLPTFLPTLQDIAEKMGSRIGEVAQAKVLAQIAREGGGFVADVARWNNTESMMELIKKYVDRNVPCIIAYDNTDTGDPGVGTQGDRAHWAVIFGYVNTTGTFELLATHGWGHYYLWSAEQLRASNEQLERYEAKSGTWVNIETGGNPGWSQREKKTMGYDLAVTHKAKTLKVANRALGRYEMHPDPSLKAEVRGFAPIDPMQDLKRQLVIVTPLGETDFSPPASLPVAKTTPTSTGRGDKY